MTDDIPVPKRGKLPPLSMQGEENAAQNSRESRPKKKKPRPSTENVENAGENGTTRTRSASRGKGTGSGRKNSFQSPPPPTQSGTPRKKTTKSQNQRNSQTEGDSSPGPSSSPGRPKKKKPVKRQGQPRTLSKEVLLAEDQTNGEVVSARSAASAGKKKKKKKKASAVESEVIGLEAELQGMDDDVMVTDETQSIDDTKWTVQNMRSEPVNKVFIEQKSGFKSADKTKVAKKRAEEQMRAMELPLEATSVTTIQFALSTHRVFKVISVFINGLFAGIALWQIVASFMLLNKSDVDFLENYHDLAIPVQCIFYFMFALCTVAAFDRYDIGRPNKRFVQRAFTLQSGAISCLFYLVGLIFSVAIAADDNRIGLYKEDPTLWEDEEDTSSRLNTWKILNAVRGVLALLGWLVISLRPATDRTTKNLERADENIIEPQFSAQPPEIEFIRSSGV